MIDILQSQLALFLLLAPLGVVGVWRWSVYLFKVNQAKRYRPIKRRSEHTPSEVTFVVPVYNEEPAVFERAMRTWIREQPHEIILIIDQNDTVCYDIAEKVKQKTAVKIRPFFTKRKGKREALVDGIALVKTQFLTLIDSDTFFSQGVVHTLLAPFTSPQIGGVAPRQRVWRPKTIVQRVYQIQLEERYDVEMPFLDVGGLTTTCISGRTAMYRTVAVQDKLSELENEWFWGSRCISGDDKCLTRIVQRNNWLVKYQDNALVWTHAAPDLKTYLKQRVRWTRNTWRSDLQALFMERHWIFRNRYLTFHSIDRFVQPFTLILGPIFFFTALFAGFFYAALLFLVWIFFTRLLKVSSHLARFPEAIMVLPHYIVITYIIGVLKIFALFTIWKQGWITRWNKNRFSPSSFMSFITDKAAPVTATVLMIAIMGQGVNLFYQKAIAAAMSNEDYRSRTISYEEARVAAIALEESIRNPEDYRNHLVEIGDTLELIAKRYNVVPAVIKAPEGFTVGEKVQIPTAALRTPNSIDDLSSRELPNISYIPFSQNTDKWQFDHVSSQNIVQLSGRGTAISIDQLFTVLQSRYDDALVVNQGNGSWLLKASIAIGKDVTLYFPGETVRWLKLKSSDDYYTWITSFNGSIHIEDTRITSWDDAVNDYDEELTSTGRSFLLAKNSGRMDIIDSEIGYLGHSAYADRPRGYPFGGSYGLSWKIEDGTLDETIITGNLIGTEIHHNKFGIYTYGSTAQLMQENTVHHNVDYGFDPHDDSNHLIIENNLVHNNGNHGIITSKRCFMNIIAHNTSRDNALHGIMVDQASDKNVIRNNELYNNTDGVVALDSHQNVIFDNHIFNNRNAGVRFNIMSSKNLVFNNEIRNNHKGVYVYKGAIDNHFLRNELAANKVGIHLRDAVFNVFVDNENKANGTPIQLHEQSLKNYVVFSD